MRTRLVLARVAVGLALTTGLTGIGGAAAMAVETEVLPACLPLATDCSETSDPVVPVPTPSASIPSGDGGTIPVPTPSMPVQPTSPSTPSPAPSVPATPVESAQPQPQPAPVQSVPQQPQVQTPVPAEAPAGGAPSSGTSAGSGATTTSTTKSSTPSAAVTTAAPPVQLAPSGPALTSVESAAAGEAVERVRETLPTSVEPSTRLLAEPVSSGSGPPSPNDSGLLALIVAMGAASIGCAVAAVLLRGRDKARHLS